MFVYILAQNSFFRLPEGGLLLVYINTLNGSSVYFDVKSINEYVKLISNRHFTSLNWHYVFDTLDSIQWTGGYGIKGVNILFLVDRVPDDASNLLNYGHFTKFTTIMKMMMKTMRIKIKMMKIDDYIGSYSIERRT